MVAKPSQTRAADPVAQRLRERRQALGFSLQKVARAVGLRAPSHIHHIEKGEKIPSEDVAARLALVLGDDPALYRAWVRARQRGDLLAAQEAVRELEQWLAGPRQSPVTSQPMTVAGGGSQAPSLLLRIPILLEGTEPEAPGGPATRAVNSLRLDPVALPNPEELVRPFAYRLTDAGARRAAPVLRRDDLVIVTRNAWPLHPEPVYAVRFGGKIVLTRVRWMDDSLWLPAANQGGEPERLPPSGTPPAALVGRLAAVIRANP
jgi:transcriptional regulator with XRE-family HTH domain